MKGPRLVAHLETVLPMSGDDRMDIVPGFYLKPA